ncbi:MAG: hypothetical protein KA198_10630 [Chitinophagaceae bacterium]|nr:hypothetical protein [Chitinophagaceae bacterium]
METRNKIIKKKDTNVLMYGKMQPQAPDLEVVVLGAMMLEPQCINQVMAIIPKPECLYVDAHQRILASINRLRNKNISADFMAVCNDLRANNELEMVGGSYFVTKLTQDVVSSAEVETHARIVMQKYMMRELINIAGNAINEAYKDATDCFELIDSSLNNISELLSQGTKNKVSTLQESINLAVENCIKNRESDSITIGTSTGFPSLDEIIGGLNPPDLTILAGDTGGGKTSLALNIAFAVAETEYITYVSLEMKGEQLAIKKLSHDTGYSYREIQMGKIRKPDGTYEKLPDYVIKQLIELKSQLAHERFLLHDKGGLSVSGLRNIVAYNKLKFGCDKYIVDYLQLMNARDAGRKFGSKTEEMSYISNSIKNICTEFNVTIIALSQFSRREKGSAPRMHKLSDLKDTGSIEQDADNVILLFEPSRYGITEIDFNGEIRNFNNIDDLILQGEKSRSGGVKYAYVQFNKRGNKIIDPEAKQNSQHTDFSTAPNLKPLDF